MSNYISSLNSFYRNSYFHTRMTGLYNQLNTTPYVYGNTIEKQNYYNSEGITYLNRIQEGAKVMSDKLRELGSLDTFQKMAAFSSNNHQVMVDPASDPAEDMEDKVIEVDQLATSQRNQGDELESSARYTGALGTQTFELDVSGKKTLVSIEVKATDSNQAVQQKMVNAINESDAGVRAQVVLNSKNRTGAVSIESNETGATSKATFSIRDVSGSLVADTGADRKVRDAQDASYRVDGVAHTSSTNRIDLGDGVRVTLHSPTDQPVTISAGRDGSHGASTLLEVVNSYNDLLNAARTSTNGNKRLENDLVNAAKSYLSSLEDFGVTMNKDGSLYVDRAKLDAAGADGSLEKHFSYYSGKNFGFASRLSTIARNVENSPGSYVSKPVERDRSQVNYFGADKGFSLQSLLYNNLGFARMFGYENTYGLVGMLFNIYV